MDSETPKAFRQNRQSVSKSAAQDNPSNEQFQDKDIYYWNEYEYRYMPCPEESQDEDHRELPAGWEKRKPMGDWRTSSKINRDYVERQQQHYGHTIGEKIKTAYTNLQRGKLSGDQRRVKRATTWQRQKASDEAK